ncbi:hypothetical protein H4R21_000621 [Coemansia helicoidea]|uniref:Uncharacterized protein n=1 Tax=Coemansia helicoidea TaxID=1286919 RepID=A0ACC1LFL1_9FUNG|nr:hypothetical protein H4R21_000621 [Coemansia helicoidea]
MRSIDFASQRSGPTGTMSRLSQSLAPGSLKEPQHHGLPTAPYLQLAGSGHANASRASLLSMAGARDTVPEMDAFDSPRLSLDPAMKNYRSSRALSGEHIPRSPDGMQRPPPLDPDLDALNRLPRFRPLVVAPASNRLSGLFHTGVRYIEPTAEQLNLDETELTGLCFSFRDYVCDRTQRVCDRQSELACAARHIGACASETQTRVAAVSHQARLDLDGLSVIRSLQKQAEKSYELIQDILHDLERLEAALPAGSKIVGSDDHAAAEFPRLARMMAQRRRSSLHSASPRSSMALRRHIAAKSGGVPAFPARTTSISPLNPRGPTQSAGPPDALAASSRPRPGPYRLPPPARQSSVMAPARTHSRRGSDVRALRPRTSRNSVTGSGGPGSERSNLSGPPSPNAADEARLSFDGESIGMQAASMSIVAATDAPRATPKRPAQPFGSLRPLSMVRSVYGDRHGSYSRSEVSLSREQVVWSPQITGGANDAAFGCFDHAEALAQLVLTDAEIAAMQSPGAHGASDDASSSGPLSVPMDISGSPRSATEDGRRTSGPRRGRLSVSAVQGAAHAEAECAEYSAAAEQTAQRGGVFDPTTALGSARIPPLRPRVPNRPSGSPASPKSLPHALSMQAAPPAESMAVTPPMRPATPISPPPEKRQSLPPQFPLEAARMLKQMMAELADKGAPEPRAASRCTTPHEAAAPDYHYGDGGQVRGYAAEAAVHQRSRTSSLAASQQSATEGSDGAEQIQSAGTVRTVAESARGSGPWVRANPERMSTWSASSARTLADAPAGSRVSSADDPFRASKRPLSSAALATLSASAAMINRQARANASASSSRKVSAAHNGSSGSAGGVRVAGGRPAVDLGLSIRTDLEQRVRSCSESGQNPLQPQDGRPHSSMGFHDPEPAGWGTRPGSIHVRHHSPFSASLRHFRPDKPNPNRRSVMSIRSRASKPGSLSAGVSAGDAPGDAPSAGSSYSSNGPERLMPPPLPAAGPPAPPAATGKRRARTMDPQD